ncbi:hypothetical protein ACFYM3_12840 [Streptomyces massasporeus]|uniref:Uncharacterized protein n=1 Tax=Streptomyces massasporeus TaxID=67324 RepID=A0ABW6LBM5_9ACTN
MPSGLIALSLGGFGIGLVLMPVAVMVVAAQRAWSPQAADRVTAR